jgi:flagellar basal-body rod protein FlgB
VIKGLFDTGAMPILERTAQFTAARHEIIAHNIANGSVPNFVSETASVESFQEQLGDAIDQRRGRGGIFGGRFDVRDSRQIRFSPNDLELDPEPMNENLLFHDRNNRSLEHQMKDLAENAMAHNMALTMIRNHLDLLQVAIRERV